MMQSIIYQKIIIMKLWISFIIGTKPFFYKKKERFCIGGLRPWACPLGLAYTKSNHFPVFLGSKEQPHLNQIKMGNVLRPKKLIIGLLYNMIFAKQNYIYIMCP